MADNQAWSRTGHRASFTLRNPVQEQTYPFAADDVLDQLPPLLMYIHWLAPVFACAALGIAFCLPLLQAATGSD